MPYYTVDEFAELVDAKRQDVLEWIGDGLPIARGPSDDEGPLVDEELAMAWLEARDLVEDVSDDDDED